MAKYGNTHFLQLTRSLWEEEYQQLSVKAKWLFVCLNELEQRYCGKDSGFFFRTDEELCIDTGMSINTVKAAKRELKEKAQKLIRISRGHWTYITTGKSSKYQPTVYQILR